MMVMMLTVLDVGVDYDDAEFHHQHQWRHWNHCRAGIYHGATAWIGATEKGQQPEWALNVFRGMQRPPAIRVGTARGFPV